MIDDTDRKILELLQADARMTHTAIAQAVGLSAPSVLERIRKLEAKGIIKGYRAIVDSAALGRPITAFIRISSDAAPGPYDEFLKSVASAAREPEILECHSVAGEDCFVLKAKVAGPGDLEALLGRLRNSGRIGRTVSMIVLSTLKEDTILPTHTTPIKHAKR